jgi:hypothetical protein
VWILVNQLRDAALGVARQTLGLARSVKRVPMVGFKGSTQEKSRSEIFRFG